MEAVHVHFLSFYPSPHYKAGSFSPILKMEKLRLREVNKYPQGHLAGKWQDLHFNPILQVPLLHATFAFSQPCCKQILALHQLCTRNRVQCSHHHSLHSSRTLLRQSNMLTLQITSELINLLLLVSFYNYLVLLIIFFLWFCKMEILSTLFSTRKTHSFFSCEFVFRGH